MTVDLLEIDGYTFPKPANFNVTLDDKTNEFNAENGTRVIEIIREDIVKISVSYGSLTANALYACKAALRKIVNAKFYNPYSGVLEIRRMEVKGIASGKQYHDNNISTWSLSFNLEEL